MHAALPGVNVESIVLPCFAADAVSRAVVSKLTAMKRKLGVGRVIAVFDSSSVRNPAKASRYANSDALLLEARALLAEIDEGAEDPIEERMQARSKLEKAGKRVPKLLIASVLAALDTWELVRPLQAFTEADSCRSPFA